MAAAGCQPKLIIGSRRGAARLETDLAGRLGGCQPSREHHYSQRAKFQDEERQMDGEPAQNIAFSGRPRETSATRLPPFEIEISSHGRPSGNPPAPSSALRT